MKTTFVAQNPETRLMLLWMWSLTLPPVKNWLGSETVGQFIFCGYWKQLWWRTLPAAHWDSCVVLEMWRQCMCARSPPGRAMPGTTTRLPAAGEAALADWAAPKLKNTPECWHSTYTWADAARRLHKGERGG